MNDIPKELIASEFIMPDMEVFWELTKRMYTYIGLQLFAVCIICTIIFLIMSVVSGVRYCIDKKKYDSDIYKEDFMWNIGYLISSVFGMFIIVLVLPMLT